jgi:hypothetical protein
MGPNSWTGTVGIADRHQLRDLIDQTPAAQSGD